MSWPNFSSYLSPAEKKAKALKTIKTLQSKGRVIEPPGELTSRLKIATSFWCQHLESFSDYENRLPRGRTYVRNGSVLHLDIQPGSVNALVQGSELYELAIRIAPLGSQKWQSIQSRCRGKIGSLIELLQGTISGEIMTIVTDKADGLFPSPEEIQLNCNCPDWASMCKHVAAVLYGIGARLDTAPELLFKLRGVDHHELIAIEAPPLLGSPGRPSRRRTLDAGSLGSVFGIDLDASPAAPPQETSADQPAPIRLKEKSTPRKSPTLRTKNAGSREAAPEKKPEPLPPNGETLCDLRAKLTLSRTSFARKLGVSVALLARWERTKDALIVPKSVQAKLARIQAG